MNKQILYKLNNSFKKKMLSIDANPASQLVGQGRQLKGKALQFFNSKKKKTRYYKLLRRVLVKKNSLGRLKNFLVDPTFSNYQRIRDLSKKNHIRRKEEMQKSIALVFKHIWVCVEGLFENLHIRSHEIKNFFTRLKTFTIMVNSNFQDQPLLKTKLFKYIYGIAFRYHLDTSEFFAENSLVKGCHLLGYEPDTFNSEQFCRILINKMRKKTKITFEDLQVIIETCQKEKKLFYVEPESFQNSGPNNHSNNDNQLNELALNLETEESFPFDCLEGQYSSSKMIEDEPFAKFVQNNLLYHEMSLIEGVQSQSKFDSSLEEESDLIFFDIAQKHSIQEDHQTMKPQNEFKIKLSLQMSTPNHGLTNLDNCLTLALDLENITESD